METNTLLEFLRKASEDEGLRKELVALAGRYGVPLGSDELSEVTLDQVAGGLLPAINLARPKLQTSLLGKEPVDAVDEWQIKTAFGVRYKLDDGSV